jgi:transmembrane sensor
MISRIKAKLGSNGADEQAAAWVLKISQGELSTEEMETFVAWLEQSPKNSAAYQGMVAIAYNVPPISRSELADLGLEGPVGGGLRVNRGIRPRTWALAGLAAACVAAMVAIPLFRDTTVHHADAGERRLVSLPDKSRIELNSRSEVAVNYTDGVRYISLPAGEAFFDVAHEKDRPFVVHTNKAIIRALGTKFNVRLDQEDTIVSVLEGAVEVKTDGTDAARREVVSAGQQLQIAASGARLKAEDVERATSWRHGRVEFDNTTLETAIKEINRYRTKAIVINDPDLREVHITGSFNIDEMQDFLRALSRIDYIEIVETPTTVALVKVR